MPRSVLHILGTAQPEGMAIARIVSALARGLDPERYRIHACFLGGNGPLVGVLEAAGVQVSILKWSGGARDLAGAWRFWRGLQGQRFEIVHVHFGGGSVLWLARAATHGKIVLQINSRVNEAQGFSLVTHSGRGADRVIAISRAIAERMVGTEALVIYPGVENLDEKGPRFIWPGSLTGRVLGATGRLVKIKGIIDLIHALAALRLEMPDIRLDITGSGPERVSIEAEVRNLGLENHVRFLGWCPDLKPIFAGWDIFVQPSLEEGYGLAALEAMAAGLPVVATEVGGLPEIVEDGKTGWLVPPKDRAALADRLRALLLNPQERRAMGVAGRTRVLEHFSAGQMVTRISDLYDSLLRDGSHSI